MRRVALAIAIIVAPAFGASAQAGDESPRPEISSVSQYAELVPTASGPKAPGGTSTTVSPEAESLLQEVATSPDYGAPSKSSAAVPDRTARERDSSLGRTLSATADAAAVGDARVAGLLVVLVAMTAGAAAVSLRRRAA